jgi:hypothetical protein
MGKKLIYLFLFSTSLSYSAQPKKHVPDFGSLVEEIRNRRAARQQASVTFDLSQRNRPIHDEQKAADFKKSDNEKKVD